MKVHLLNTFVEPCLKLQTISPFHHLQISFRHNTQSWQPHPSFVNSTSRLIEFTKITFHWVLISIFDWTKHTKCSPTRSLLSPQLDITAFGSRKAKLVFLSFLIDWANLTIQSLVFHPCLYHHSPLPPRLGLQITFTSHLLPDTTSRESKCKLEGWKMKNSESMCHS